MSLDILSCLAPCFSKNSTLFGRSLVIFSYLPLPYPAAPADEPVAVEEAVTQSAVAETAPAPLEPELPAPEPEVEVEVAVEV